MPIFWQKLSDRIGHGAIGRSMATMVMHPNGTIGAPYRRWSPLAPTLGYVAVMIYIYIYHGAGKRDRRILLLPNWQRTANVAKLASIVIRIYHDFRKFPILGPWKTMLRLS